MGTKNLSKNCLVKKILVKFFVWYEDFMVQKNVNICVKKIVEHSRTNQKTREHHEHARGTPKDLPRNTQTQKQRIIPPFIARGEKELTIDITMNLTGTRRTYIKQRPRNKHK